VVKGIFRFTDVSRTVGVPGIYGKSADRRLNISLVKHATFFQAEVYAILICVYETDTQDRPQKYVSICSDSQAALKALQATKRTPPLVRQCQNALNNISTRHTGGCTGSLGMPGKAEIKSPSSSQGTVLF
jgi:hypothetical protein